YLFLRFKPQQPVGVTHYGNRRERHCLMGVADALAISRATLRNMKQNLLGAFIYNSIGIPVAAGILWPFTGTLLNPVVAG
ncbi:hypothetical protein, partial [Shigella sonnei]|uniref:hypothetical protein n=1 Tax=Shigella sonnei TaxID=624 RepID=UPI001492F03B